CSSDLGPQRVRAIALVAEHDRVKRMLQQYLQVPGHAVDDAGHAPALVIERRAGQRRQVWHRDDRLDLTPKNLPGPSPPPPLLSLVPGPRPGFRPVRCWDSVLPGFSTATPAFGLLTGGIPVRGRLPVRGPLVERHEPGQQ